MRRFWQFEFSISVVVSPNNELDGIRSRRCLGARDLTITKSLQKVSFPIVLLSLVYS